MTGFFNKLTILVAVALVTALGAITTTAQNPRRPKTQPTTQQKGDTTRKQDQLRDKDQDFDRDRDRDRDQDFDRDRDRDRLSRPMTAQERDAMERQMMQSRDHIMAVGYRQNMLNFALMLRQRLEAGGTVDRNLARNTVREIKRNFDQMVKRHKNHKKEMGSQNRERMSYMIQEMEEHQERIRNTIRTLENDSKAQAPDSRQMLMHLNQLEEQIRVMDQARARKNEGS